MPCSNIFLSIFAIYGSHRVCDVSIVPYILALPLSIQLIHMAGQIPWIIVQVYKGPINGRHALQNIL